MVSSNVYCTCLCSAKGMLHIGVKVCDEYWSDFQSSWSWEPTESQKKAGTRIMITSCFLSWTTRSPATSYTASTPRMHRAMSGSSYHGLLTSLQYAVPHILHHILKLHTHTLMLIGEILKCMHFKELKSIVKKPAKKSQYFICNSQEVTNHICLMYTG